MSRWPLSSIRCLLLALVSGTLLGGEAPPAEPPRDGPALSAPAPEEGSAKAPAAETLSDPSAQEEFEQGKALFEEKKYREAERLFKKARGSAKEKEDRELLDRWILGTAGGFSLEKLKILAKSRGRLVTYEQVQSLYPKYRETPAGELFRAYVEEIESDLFVSLETFDVRSGYYTEKYGKTFIDEPAQSVDGTQFLRWTSTADRKAAALKVINVPRDWSEFLAVEFWVNVRMPPRGPEVVLMSALGQGGGEAGKRAKRRASADTFFHSPVTLGATRGQWRRIRLSLTEFKPQGDASLSNVAYFQIQIPAGAQFDLSIDKIVAVKKEEGPAGRRR